MAKQVTLPVQDMVGRTITEIVVLSTTAYVTFDDGSTAEFYAMILGGCCCVDSELEITYSPKTV